MQPWRSPSLDLSVVILTHNTRELLRACLDSLYAKTRDIALETIVVDNRSDDGTRALVERDYPDVRYVYRDTAFGFAPGNNVGLRMARGRYALLLNSDTELDNDALDRMVAFMDRHPDCGIAGCRLRNTDGSLQLSCRRFPGYMTALFNRYSLLTRLFPANAYSQAYLMTDVDHGSAGTVDWVSGACLFVRREAMDEVGLLDERLIFSTEDVDWCKRMWESGWTVWYNPDASVMHHIGATSRLYPLRAMALKHVSMYRYYDKHISRGVLANDLAVVCGLALRVASLAVRQLLGIGRGAA